ncbi:MAG TPA: AtpZ/AtpI family protein [Phycisphaerae bacterium]|nr:AtpZ/AtpI family protein [Phycisphaerae bacterium]
MDDERPQPNLLRYATVGIEFLVVFLAFFAGGWLLDKLFGTSPGFTVLGGIVGFGAAFYRITRQGWGILKDANPDEQDDQGKDGLG